MVEGSVRSWQAYAAAVIQPAAGPGPYGAEQGGDIEP